MRGKPARHARGQQGRRIIPAHAGQTRRQTVVGARLVVAADDVHHRQERIIPAHAGQTTSRTRTACSTPDHPRACGANQISVVIPFDVNGSSPRMRGKLGWSGRRRAKARIIPAHAGQTVGCHGCWRRLADHPRACGANLNHWGIYGVSPGSSPRMRGKLSGARRRVRRRRIIPAHAGQTRTGGGGRLGKPDHPRACGANNGYVSGYGPLDGSSPRMRGKRPEHRGPNGRGRIIPAHAGQTPPSAPSCRRRPDHPRACGANSIRHPFAVTALGSSPRMRGKQRPVAPKRVAVRIIPAHAGQTDLPYGRAIESTDHPRACGANAHQRGGQHAQTGSSPRMRGKLFGTPDTWNHPRIIPAHAGQTRRRSCPSP